MPRSTLKVPAKARRCKGRAPTSFAAGRPALLKLRLAAEAITPLTTWSAIRDEALKRALLHYPRSDLNPARSSSVKIFGCSQAAK